MKLVEQLYKEHCPEAGVYGDCYRTCIASLLNLEPGDVPHFYDPGYAGALEVPFAQARGDCQRWLQRRGLWMVDVPFGSDKDEGPEFLLKHQEGINPGVYYILAGWSIAGCGHVVVCCGDRVVCDPAGRDLDHALVGPLPQDPDDPSQGYNYWVSWIIPIHQTNSGVLLPEV